MYSFTEKQIKEIALQLQNGETPTINLGTGNVEVLEDVELHEGASGTNNSVFVINDLTDAEYLNLMKGFVLSISDKNIKSDFEKALRDKAPKLAFRKMLDYHDIERPKWFEFKNKFYIDYVKITIMSQFN